jgi:hypothetical protein
MATIPISDGDPKDSYTSSASQTIFPYTFWIKEEAHLAVYVNGLLQTLTTDYTISAVQQPAGANVVFVSGLNDGDAVVLVYDPLFERTAEYTGTIRLEALNTELTYLLTLLQSNQRKIDDALRPSDTETVSFSGELPALTGQGQKVLALKQDLSGIEYRAIAEGATLVSNFEAERFSGDGVDTTFDLSFTPFSANTLIVLVGGVEQFPNVDYLVSGTTLTFSTAPASGTDNIVVRNLSAVTATTTPGDGTVTEDKIGADAVTNSKIATGAVDTDEIADDAVTLAKLEDGTQGDILYYGAAGTPTRLGAGTAGQVLQSNGTGADPSWENETTGATITYGTATSTSSGGSVTLSGIPAAIKKLEIVFDGVSISGSNDVLLTIGDSGGLETTGYTAGASTTGSSGNTQQAYTESYGIVSTNTGSNKFYGSAILNRVDAGSNVWVLSGNLSNAQTGNTYTFGGSKELSGELTQFSLETSGSDTFDDGQVNWVAYS